MTPRMKQLFRARRGSSLVEFALSSLIIVGVLLTTFEFGLEVFLRQSSERSLAAAAIAFSETGDPSIAQDQAVGQMPAALRRCIQPLEIQLYDGIDEIGGTGRAATGGASDAGAQIAMLRLECIWARMTPIPRSILGSTLVHRGKAIVRIR